MSSIELDPAIAQELAAAAVKACWDVFAPCSDPVWFVKRSALCTRSLTLEFSIVDLPVALEQTSRAIVDVVKRALAAFARSLNDRATVARLPRELFCRILEFLPLKDRIRATHVCHLWRETALSTPWVWSTVISPDGMPEGALTAILDRSCSSDLALSINVTSQNLEEVHDCLWAHIKRCVTLELKLLNIGFGDVSVDSITRALCNPAPRLRSFQLWDPYDWFNKSQQANFLLFAGRAPNLDLLKVYTCIANIHACDSLRSVKSLKFCHNALVTSRTLAGFLANFPCLEGLAIEVESDGIPGPDQDEWAPLALPESLVELRFISNGGSSLPELFSYFSIGQNVRLRVQYDEPPGVDETAATFARLLAGVPISDMQLSLRSDDGMDVDVSLLGAPDEEWTHSMENIPFSAAPLHDGFATLTSLRVSEEFFAIGPPLPEVPMMTTLTISLLQGSEQIYYGHDSIFMLPHSSERWLSCPRLRTLRLSGTGTSDILSGGYLTYLAPYMVRDFVDLQLQFATPRLSQLILENCMLLESRVDDVASLLALVEDVQSQRTGPAEPARFAQLADWDVLE